MTAAAVTGPNPSREDAAAAAVRAAIVSNTFSYERLEVKLKTDWIVTYVDKKTICILVGGGILVSHLEFSMRVRHAICHTASFFIQNYSINYSVKTYSAVIFAPCRK